ncbi:fimbria/pilus outer membrane usher protein (plasmid) [Pantoea sp. BJ2]|uniref:Fimbria/pilus outer membrane usher protein n=1 Tax=Pantoea sp. BJ2 TaxID=3141322 RepID=A0AAU7U441_9GAMM
MPNKTQDLPRPAPLSLFVARQFARSCILCGLSLIGTTQADTELWFNPAALSGGSGDKQAVADLSAFNDGTQPPGVYHSEIYVNGAFIGARDVTYVKAGKTLAPAFTAGYWRELGISPKASAALEAMPDDSIVDDPSKFIPDLTTAFTYNRMRLDISIPQSALRFRARDYISPSMRDDGLPSAMVTYGLNYNNSWRDQADSDYSNLFLRLGSGINLGGWRLRNDSTFTRNTGDQPSYDNDGNRIVRQKTETRWQSLNTYAYHDIAPLDARLTLGDSSTPGDLFDSITYRGVRLTSDDGMLPDSMRGFAPVVRGVARSNALITVRQNGAVIYKTNVAPGPFVIRDIYPTANSGNLDVSIQETDGTVTSFTQAFSAVPGMQREGQMRFSLTGGKYRAYSDTTREPSFIQGTLQYGLFDGTSVYGGVIGAEDYKSGMLGLGQGLGEFGSVSLDVTHASTHLDGGPSRTGQSYRAQYSKDLLQSGTSFVLAGYRYSTEGYYSFSDAAQRLPAGAAYDDNDPYDYWRRTHTKRNRLQAQISQQLGDYGSLYVSAYKQDYWGESGTERTTSLGYSVGINDIYYSLTLNDSRYPQFKPDRSAYFNVSVPLDRWLSKTRVSYSLYSDNDGRTRNQVGLNGTALKNGTLDWNVQEGWANKGEGNSGSAGATWYTPVANVLGSYGYDGNGRTASIGLNGSVTAHPYGVTLSQPVGETATLIRAPGAAGVEIQNQRGVKTDGRGYAIVPYASAYHRNRIDLNTTSLPDNVDVPLSSQLVIPTYGALVLADFKPNVGARVLATLTHRGKPVPFGATASLLSGDEAAANSGIVAEDGQLYLSGVKDQGDRVKVSWGKGADEQCVAPLQLAGTDEQARIRTLNAVCQ